MTLLSTIKVVFNYLKSDIVKKQRAFKIGFFTIFLVVFFIALLLNTISLSPLIFLRQSENVVGEADLIMTPIVSKKDVKGRMNAVDYLFSKNKGDDSATTDSISSQLSDFKLLDFTQIHNKLKDSDYISGLVPRWLFPANSTNINSTYWQFRM